MVLPLEIIKGKLKEKQIKIFTVFIRATPIMETLTGIMIAILIFYSGKLIIRNELDINNFFSFLAAMMLAYQPIRSLATINMMFYQGAAGAERVFKVLKSEAPTILVIFSSASFLILLKTIFFKLS